MFKYARLCADHGQRSGAFFRLPLHDFRRASPGYSKRINAVDRFCFQRVTIAPNICGLAGVTRFIRPLATKRMRNLGLAASARRAGGFSWGLRILRSIGGSFQKIKAATLVMLQPPAPAREPTAWIHAPSQPLMQSLLSQCQTPTAPRRVSRFFRVWPLLGLPRQANHPAYFGSAKFDFANPFSRRRPSS